MTTTYTTRTDAIKAARALVETNPTFTPHRVDLDAVIDEACTIINADGYLIGYQVEDTPKVWAAIALSYNSWDAYGRV